MERRIVRMLALAGALPLGAAAVIEWQATRCVGPAFGVHVFSCQAVAPVPGACSYLAIIGGDLVDVAWLAALFRLAAQCDWLLLALVLFLFLSGLVVYFVAEPEDVAAA